MGAIAELARQVNIDMAVMSLAWLLGRAGVASVVVGARTPQQILRNAAAGDLNLPGELASRLEQITEPLRRKLGANPDMWESKPRLR